MFILSKVEDTVKIQTSDFHKTIHDAVIAAVNCKYANKVILETGLCIQLYDVLSVGEAFLHPGSAAQHVTVVFRMIVLCPFVGEIIVGTIKSNSRAGVVVTLGFFDDILIPPELMVQPVEFNETEQVWCWKLDKKQEFFMDDGEPIRFRVAEVQFNSSNTFVDGHAVIPQPRGAAGPAAVAGSHAAGGGGMPPQAACVAGRGGANPGLGGAAPVASAGGRGPGMPGASHAGGIAAAGSAAGGGKPWNGKGAPPTSSPALELSGVRVCPMIVKGSINEEGLGLTSWWADTADN